MDVSANSANLSSSSGNSFKSGKKLARGNFKHIAPACLPALALTAFEKKSYYCSQITESQSNILCKYKFTSISINSDHV